MDLEILTPDHPPLLGFSLLASLLLITHIDFVLTLANPVFRTFMKPIMESEMFQNSASAVSLAAFPKDTAPSPLTVIFGTGSATASRRSSKRDSYISLYDNPSPDDWFAAAATQAAAATAGGIGISPTGGSSSFARTREMRTGSFSKAFWSVTSSLNTLSTTQLMSVFHPQFCFTFFSVCFVFVGETF